jgi:hypothetical protein
MAQADVLPAFFLMKGPHELLNRERTIIVPKKPEFIRSIKKDVLDEFSQFLKLVFPHCLVPDICPRRCWSVNLPFILDTIPPILYGIASFIRKARSREYFMAFSTRQTVLQSYYYLFYYFSGEGSVH